jgi:transposase-like protein
VTLSELFPTAVHDTHQYANNQADLSHQPTRERERGMHRFESSGTRNDFSMCMRRYTISSTSVAISWPLVIIGNYVSVPLRLGRRP